MIKEDSGSCKCDLTGNFQDNTKGSPGTTSPVWSRRMEAPGKMFMYSENHVN